MKALRAADLVASIGVNTHIGNAAIAQPYGNIPLIVQCVNYLGVKSLRDMPGGALAQYQQVAAGTGAKFVMAISETGPGNYAGDLAFNGSLASSGYVMAFEGCNEPDSAYATSLGGSAAAAAAFQPHVAAAATQWGVKAIANSFGNIWPDPGSYGTTGNLSAHADWGNAHIYYDPHQCGCNGDGYFGLGVIQWVQKDAALTTPGKPVANTEFGWQHGKNSEAAVAAYVLTFFLSAHAQWGSPFSGVYALFDDGSGTWGLFNDNGTPRPVATAIRNLIMLLQDESATARSFTPDAPNITVGNLPAGENVNAGGHAALYQKASGELWLALWNDQALTTDDTATPANQAKAVSSVSVTISGHAPIGTIEIYDPLVSSTAQRSITNAAAFNVSLPAHPILCRFL